MNIVTESDIYDDYSYASCVNWEIEKTPERYQKKLEFNIEKPETGLKKIYFNINVNNNEIDDMNHKKIVHPSNDLTNDDYSNIEDHKIHQEQTNRNNNFYINNKLQSSSHLEDPNKTNDWKTANSHEGELVMAYNTKNGSNTIRLRTFYTLYIKPKDSGNGHLIFKLSTKQILVTMKYQPIRVHAELLINYNRQKYFADKSIHLFQLTGKAFLY